MSGDGTERPQPLNLTDEEIEYLWGMMKREVGKEGVQFSDDRGIVESLHTKVRSLQMDTQQEGDA